MSETRIEVHIAATLPARADEVSLLLERAVHAVLLHEQVESASISLALVDDQEIARLNQQYLKHDGPTDVISFPLFAAAEDPVGDIYIGYEQAGRQAQELGVPLDTELARLAVHGTLHVLGYEHADGGAPEDSEMWRRQETILQRVLHS